MKVTHRITTVVEGNLDEVVNSSASLLAQVSLGELLDTMKQMALALECVAHLQGQERALLPICEKAREQIALLGEQA